MPTQSTAERLLVSLHTLLSGAMPPGAKVLRNAILPEKVPAAGVVILRDGDPGPPEVWLTERDRTDKQRSEDRKVDGARLDRIETDIRSMRDMLFDAFQRGRSD